MKSDILGQWKGDKTEVDHGTGFGECLVYYRAVSSVSAVVQHAIHTRVITSLENDWSTQTLWHQSPEWIKEDQKIGVYIPMSI